MAKNYSFSLLLVLFALVTVSLSQSSKPVRLNITQANTTLVRSLLSYGLNGVLYSIAGEGQIYQRRNFSLGDVYSVYREALPNNTNYYFWVRLFLRGNTRVYVDTNFTVEYVPGNRSRRLLGYDYDIDFHESRRDEYAYRRIPRSQYNDSVVQRLLKFGNAFVVEQARNRSQIPAGVTFDVDRIGRIYNRSSGASTFYKFEVLLRNATRDLVIDADYTVQYLPASRKAAVLDTDFDVSDYGQDRDDRDDRNDRSDGNDGYYGYSDDRDHDHDHDDHDDQEDHDDNDNDDDRDYDDYYDSDRDHDDHDDRDDDRSRDYDRDNEDDDDFSDYLGKAPQRT